jgi:uncharacterized protein (DUF4415 family)
MKGGNMAEEQIVRYVGALRDGTHIIEHPGGRLERRRSETDWARLDAMPDEEIERSIADDPDWAEFKDIDWSKATLVVPKPKKSISLRVDEDVIDFFKSTGKGYQTRINAVLRHYMREQKRRNK